MFNKFFFLQLAAAIVCSCLVAYLLLTTERKRTQEQQQATEYEISMLRKQLTEAQNDINAVFRLCNAQERENSVQAVPSPQPRETARELNALEEKTAALENSISGLSRRLQKMERTGQGGQNMNKVWFDDLSEEKRKIVRKIYQQELTAMREKIALSPGETAPSSEEIMQAIQESREILQERLKDVLNEEEFQLFLDSVHSSPIPTAPEPIQ